MVACASAQAQARPPLPGPGVAPPGANDPSCRSVHPPVVLLHGTRSDMTINFQTLSRALRRDGLCPWALDLPDRAQAPVHESARAVARFVEGVRAETGARRVSLVGHSSGGVIGRTYVRFHDGAGRVEDLVSFGTPQYGYRSEPPFDEVDRLYNTGCPGCDEQFAGHPFMAALNEGDPTPGRISYTQLITLQDAVATPVANQFLPEDVRVSNVVLDEVCPGRPYDHLLLAIDATVYQLVRAALTGDGPARPGVPVDCSAVGS
jgi:triacylglycerol lipase